MGVVYVKKRVDDGLVPKGFALDCHVLWRTDTVIICTTPRARETLYCYFVNLKGKESSCEPIKTILRTTAVNPNKWIFNRFEGCFHRQFNKGAFQIIVYSKWPQLSFVKNVRTEIKNSSRSIPPTLDIRSHPASKQSAIEASLSRPNIPRLTEICNSSPIRPASTTFS